jgi:hypothetical protein
VGNWTERAASKARSRSSPADCPQQRDHS